MKLRQMQCLCAVVDARFNISRAAQTLHATQPAISKQLRQFERELGADLLLRRGARPIGLTDVGERALAWARHALRCADNIRALAQERGDRLGGSITLATSHSHANYLLLPAIVAFNRRFPRVRFSVLQGAPPQVAELVHDGKVAVGVTHLPEELPRDVLAVSFLTSPRWLVAPAGHPILRHRKLSLAHISAYPLILPHSLRAGGARIVRQIEQAGLEANVAVLALDADVIKTYVAAGLGVGIIPAFSYNAKSDRRLKVRDVGHLFEPAVSAVLLRRHSHLPKYVYQFLATLDPALERSRIENQAFGDP